VAHESLKTQIDAKAVFYAGEANIHVFEKIRPTLVHVHLNEPDLGVLKESEEIDHGTLGSLLKGIHYRGYVAIEQKMIEEKDPLFFIKKSFEILRKYY
jgi:sugar phosphate isomerase/epimerase